MTDELKQQSMLAQDLQKHYNELGIDAKVYSVNQFKRVDGHWAKKPDLIIMNVPIILHSRLKDKVSMQSPIGIEYKTKGQGITKYIRAVKLQAQDRYLDGVYLIKDINKEIKLNTIAFTIEEFIESGHFIIEPYPKEVIDLADMWAERVCWAFDMPLLIKRKGSYFWSYRNYYYTLDGKEVGRYGEDGKFIEY